MPTGGITPPQAAQPKPATIVGVWQYTPRNPTTGSQSTAKVNLYQSSDGKFYAEAGGKTVQLQATTKKDAERELDAMVKAPSQVWKYTPPSGEQMQIFRNPDKTLSVQRANGQVTPLGTSNLKDAENKLDAAFPKPANTAALIARYTPKNASKQLELFKEPNGNLLARRPNGEVIDLKTPDLRTAKVKLDAMFEKPVNPEPVLVARYTPKNAAKQLELFKEPNGNLLALRPSGEVIDLKTTSLKTAERKLDAMFEKPATANAGSQNAKPEPAAIASQSGNVQASTSRSAAPAGAPGAIVPPDSSGPTTFGLSTPTTSINGNASPPTAPSQPTVTVTLDGGVDGTNPASANAPGASQVPPDQKLLPETTAANVPRVPETGANGQTIEVPAGKFDLTNPANSRSTGSSIEGTGPAPTSGFNPMLTVGNAQPTVGPTAFDSMGQQRTLTIASFANLPPAAQDQFAVLLQAGNPLAYGKKSIEQIKTSLGEASQVAVAALAQPVEVAAGTTLKAFVVVPADTVLKAGTALPGAAPLQADTTLSTATILPAGTQLPNGLTLPPGTVAGAATMTEKMAAFGDGRLENVLYLGQVIGNPLLPGGGGQAFTQLVKQAMQDGKVVVAVTQDPNNFFNPYNGKPGAYGKTPLPTFGVAWVHKDGSGVNQADRRFFNFNQSDPSANQLSTIGGRSIFAGEQQLTPEAVKEAREALGLDVVKGGRRFMFGWVPPGKEVPKFVWEDDTARALGGTNGQPVGTTWNFWLPVDPGPLDPSTLPANPNLPKPPGDAYPSPFTPPEVTQPYAPGTGIIPPAPAPGSTLPEAASQQSIVPQSPYPVDPITNIQATVGNPAVFPVAADGPGDIDLLNTSDLQLVGQLVDGYTDATFKGTVDSLRNRVAEAVTTSFMENIGTPFANTPVGGAIVQYGQTGIEKAGQVLDYLNATPAGKALSFIYGQTIGSERFQEGFQKYSDAAGRAAKTATNATMGVLAAGAASGTLRVTTFRGTDTNLDPIQKEILRRTGLPKNAEITAAYAPIPGAQDVNGRAVIWKATMPTMLLPPGLPGQAGTAQTTAGLTPTGRVLVAPSALAAGPTVMVGTMLGTPNMAINNTVTLSAGSAGLNPFLLRVGQTATVKPDGSVKISNPVDGGTALSLGAYRLSAITNVALGPVSVRLGRLADPVFLTLDLTSGGAVVKPLTGVSSVMAPQFATNAAFNANAPDVQKARQLLEDFMGGSQSPPPANQLPPGAKP